jgi:hypothetical protein
MAGGTLLAIALVAVAAGLTTAAVRDPRRRVAFAWPAIWLFVAASVAYLAGPVYGIAAALLALAPAPGRTWR